MKNILVPIGSSKNSLQTLKYGVELAQFFGSNVYVMQAYTLRSTATMANVHEVVERTSSKELEELIKQVDAGGTKIKIATYNGDVVDGVKAIDKEFGIDLIVLEPKSNDIREHVFLGSTSGKIVKQTNIPTLIVPEGNTFKKYNSALAAFKSGVVRDKKMLLPLRQFKEKFDLKLNLLLVKTPNYTEADLKINPELIDLSSRVQIS